MKKIICLICMIVFTASFIYGCGGGKSSSVMSLFVNLESDQVFKIDDTICTLPEAMIVIMTEQNKYKGILGGDGWDTEIGDTTVKQYVLDNAKSRLSIIYALCAMAEDEDIELTAEEISNAEAEALEYYGTLSESEIEYTGAEKDDVINLVKYCVLAQKVYDTIAEQNMTVEISDERARVIDIQYIYTTDKERIDDIYKKSQDENQDFLLLAEKYSQDETTETYLKRSGSPDAFEETAFSLDTDEISGVIETDSGYYIIKCVDSYLKSETKANKESLISQAKTECVSEYYDDFVGGASTLFNDGVWKKIEFSDDENVVSTAFDDLFESICGMTEEE